MLVAIDTLQKTGVFSYLSLIKQMPSLRASEQSLRHRLADLITKNNIKEIDELLDFYKNQKETAEKFPATILIQAADCFSNAEGGMGVLRRAVSIAAVLKGDADTAVKALSEKTCFSLLNDSNHRKDWQESVKKMLEISIADSTQKKLAEWFKNALVKESKTQEPLFAIGEILSQKLTVPMADECREATINCFVKELSGLKVPQAKSIIERLFALDLSENTFNAVSLWFEKIYSDGDSSTNAEFGEWLVTKLKGSAQERVKLKTKELLTKNLDETKKTSEKIELLERLEHLYPNDSQYPAQIKSLKTAKLILQLKIAGAVVVAVAITALAMYFV
jgi:hypothetical protein